jgi:polyisoprenoid-binding protein YceI
MRRLLAAASLALSFAAAPLAAQAADFTIDQNHSHVVFLVDHLGYAKVMGQFTDFSGTLSFDPADVAASKLNVTIKTGSIETQFAERNKHLKGADWFNVTEFPEMKFVGKTFTKKDDKTGTIAGDLTLLGVTKPVTLDVTFNKLGVNPLDKINSAGFSAKASLKRSDFGLKTFLPAIGDQIDIAIEIEAKQKS